MSQTRTEHDSLGDIEVPADALWRAQTQRAIENFPISGTALEPRLVRALALVKGAAATVNADLGVITAEQGTAISAAASRVAAASSKSTSREESFGWLQSGLRRDSEITS